MLTTVVTRLGRTLGMIGGVMLVGMPACQAAEDKAPVVTSAATERSPTYETPDARPADPDRAAPQDAPSEAERRQGVLATLIESDRRNRADHDSLGGLRETDEVTLAPVRRSARSCYAKALLAQPTLAGTVAITFSIGSNGAVVSATTSGVSPEVSRCIATKIKALKFPRPDNGGTVQYGFSLPLDPATTR